MSPTHRRTGTAVIRPRPVDDPELRLFVLHHAGGSHLAYVDWVERFPEEWDVVLLEAPGRGPLSGLAPHTTVEGLAARLREDVGPWIRDAPFALFGHSMGALVGYELSRQLAERGLPAPVWLGVSACESPFEGEQPVPGEPLHLMEAARLRRELAAMGGLPTAILEDDDLWRLYEPRLRADFRAVETWTPRPPATARLTVPVSLFGGEEDHVVTREQLTAWTAGVDTTVGAHWFPGGHFYWSGRAAEVVGRIVEEVDTAAPGLLSVW
ncbi:alpha/beta fold hydrolase [Streptomyces sp. NPDC048606]|uniref:thioesterase II family protein n=1 Tax=Streptomyces sp. NPDC048606 TaxID=3154726 RepID=UPI0034318B8A